MSEKNGRNGRATLEKGFPLMLNRWVAEDDSGMEFYAIGECTRYERSARILETISKHLQQYHTGEKSSNSGKGTSRTAEPVFPVSKSPKTTLSNVADTQSSDAVVRQQYSLRPGQVDGEIIRRFFSCWVWIQDAQQAARTRPSSGATADDSQRPAWNLNAPQRGGGEGQRPSDEGKGKRNAEEGPPNDDSENEGDDHSKWPQKKKKPTQPDALRRFACPFYKRTPRKYSSFRACTDPGFLNVAKVKEHLGRSHKRPPYYPRCKIPFKSEVQLHQHSEQVNPCAVNTQLPPEGTTTEQRGKIRNRTNGGADSSEAAKWITTYKILFPDNNHNEIPTPCLGLQQGTTGDFLNFLQLEAPALLHEEIRSATENEDVLAEFNTQLRPIIPGIIEQVGRRLVGVYAQGLEASVRAPGARTKEEPFDQAEHQQDDLIGVQRPPEDAQAAAGSDADVDKAPPLSQWPEFLNMEHFSQEAQQQDYYINTSWWDASQDTVL